MHTREQGSMSFQQLAEQLEVALEPIFDQFAPDAVAVALGTKLAIAFNTLPSEVTQHFLATFLATTNKVISATVEPYVSK